MKSKNLPALVKIVDEVPVVSTLDMWGPLEVEHNALLKMIKKYENEFQEIRTFGFKIQKSGGRPTTFCHLDEEQSIFLITLLKNSPVVVKFKKRLSGEFIRMGKEILRLKSILDANRQNSEWLEARTEGKPIRRSETDVIQRYVEYARENNSGSPEKYFMLLSRMANEALFDITQKFKNIRDVCTVNQLKVLSIADTIIARALEEGMAMKVHYKQIFKDVKAKIHQFVQLYGKSVIPDATVRVQISQGHVQQPLLSLKQEA
jgi:hypothetical protein